MSVQKGKFVPPVVYPDVEQEELPQPEAQAWASDVFVPLFQNTVGGLASWLGLWVGVRGVLILQQRAVQDGLLLYWCGTIALLGTVVLTVVRYFGDDMGLLMAAYRMGQRSMHGEIRRLQQALDDVSYLATTAQTMTVDADKATATIEKMASGFTAAETIIRLAYQGEKTSRRALQDRMAPAHWNRASKLQKLAGVIQEKPAGSGRWVYLDRTPQEAIARLQHYYEQDVARVKANDRYRPAWAAGNS